MDKVAAKAAMLITLRFVFLLTAMLTLTGCPGPNYAPYEQYDQQPRRRLTDRLNHDLTRASSW